jgi:hypothetical protein
LAPSREQTAAPIGAAPHVALRAPCGGLDACPGGQCADPAVAPCPRSVPQHGFGFGDLIHVYLQVRRSMFTETDQPRAGPCGPAGREAPDAELRPDESVTNALGQDLIEPDIHAEDRQQQIQRRRIRVRLGVRCYPGVWSQGVVVRRPDRRRTHYGSKSSRLGPDDNVSFIMSLSKDDPSSKRRKRRPASSPPPTG